MSTLATITTTISKFYGIRPTRILFSKCYNLIRIGWYWQLELTSIMFRWWPPWALRLRALRSFKLFPLQSVRSTWTIQAMAACNSQQKSTLNPLFSASSKLKTISVWGLLTLKNTTYRNTQKLTWMMHTLSGHISLVYITTIRLMLDISQEIWD